MYCGLSIPVSSSTPATKRYAFEVRERPERRADRIEASKYLLTSHCQISIGLYYYFDISHEPILILKPDGLPQAGDRLQCLHQG